MSKLGVITDGIDRDDLEHALQVAREYDLEYAEIQFLWGKEVGDLSAEEIGKVEKLLQQYDMKVSCISRHNFQGMAVGETEIGDEDYQRHMDAFKRCISMAQAVGSPLVRIMSFRKEMILFGENGADQWNASTGAWEKFKSLLGPILDVAEAEDMNLVVETGNNAIITSGHLGRRLIDELGTSRLKILWDPANSLYCNEAPTPDGYNALRGGYLGHFHIKDAVVDIAKAKVRQCEMGSGGMAQYLQPIADGLKEDNYQGAISLESVYYPDGGSYEDGFRASIETMKTIFG
jgi:sugar phosphate isomerase/epimerase